MVRKTLVLSTSHGLFLRKAAEMYVRHCGPLIEVHTPAKLNLFLEVRARRPDGFHEIETLMTNVSVFDTLYFRAQGGGPIRLSCRWAGGLRAAAGDGAALGTLPLEQDNLAWRAVQRLRDTAGVSWGGSMELIKRIPAASGLGGASSDAAAALLAANRAWKLGWPRQRLAQLAGELGSDPPFFLDTPSGTAICRGRGEQVEPVRAALRLDVVIVRPAAGLSTAEVYADCQVPDRPRSLQPLLEDLQRGDRAAIGRRLSNRLQRPAERLCPAIARIHQAFGRLDCLGHQMSGSGTSYFGICRQARHARRVAGRLRAAGLGHVFCASTIPGPQHRLFEASPT